LTADRTAGSVGVCKAVDRIKPANFQFRYFSNGSSFISWENGERLRLHPNFNPNPKSEVARTPMLTFVTLLHWVSKVFKA